MNSYFPWKCNFCFAWGTMDSQWAGKAESCHQPTCQPARCSMQFIIALSIFDSDAKISFLRRCLLLAAIWFQPTLNYSNDHTRHWSCKSMYVATFPLSIFWSSAKIRSSCRCLLLAEVWYQPSFNYSNDHARHWSCKSMYIVHCNVPLFNLWIKC